MIENVLSTEGVETGDLFDVVFFVVFSVAFVEFA